MKGFKEILIEVIDIEDHLKIRGIDLKHTKVIMDKENGIATFLLYNLSGKILGYQSYNPAGSKVLGSMSKLRNKLSSEEKMKLWKYFSYTSKINNKSQLSVYGLESYKEKSKYLFVTEGIFDIVKIHNLGLSGIAVLTNNPKQLKEWLTLLPQKIVVIADDDPAGNKLKKLGDISLTVPKPYGDLGDMSQEEVKNFLKDNNLI